MASLSSSNKRTHKTTSSPLSPTALPFEPRAAATGTHRVSPQNKSLSGSKSTLSDEILGGPSIVPAAVLPGSTGDDFARAYRRSRELPSSQVRGAATTATPTSSDANLESAVEDFETLSIDMKRLLQVWLHNMQSSLHASVIDVEDGRKRLDEEKLRHARELEETKALEYKRIREARTRMENEMASLARQIATERETAKQRINEDRRRLDSECNKLKSKLKLEFDRLKRETEALDIERRRIVDVNIATQTMVELNVGGVIFETARSTLTQFSESYLAAIFSGRHEIVRDREGRIFIDRDAGHFRTILNFLRDPSEIPITKDITESSSLCQEAQYYGIKFLSNPILYALGGHNGTEYLNTVEAFDMGDKTWRSMSPMETSRTYFAAANIFNRIYVAGGQNIDYKALCDVECYDSLRDSWISAPPLHIPRKSTAGAVLGDRFFVIGGFDGADILQSVELLDPRMKNWIEIAPLLQGRSSAMATACGDRIYVFGGSSGERLSTGEYYDVRMDKWEEMPKNMTENKSGGTTSALLDSIFTMGGIDSEQKVLDTVEVYDVSTEEWGFRKCLPLRIVDGASCVVSHNIVLTGGQAFGNVFRQTYMFQPQLDDWQELTPMIEQRLGHELCSVHI